MQYIKEHVIISMDRSLPMNAKVKKNIEEEIKQIRAFSAKLYNNKDEALEFLHKTGIYTQTGRLTKWYK